MLVEDELADVVLSQGAPGGQDRVAARLGEQDSAASGGVGGTELEYRPDACLQPGPPVAGTGHRRGQDACEFSGHVVVHGAEKRVGVGEALVEIPGVELGGTAHRPDRHRGFTAVAEQRESGADQKRPPFGLAVGGGHSRPPGGTRHGQRIYAARPMACYFGYGRIQKNRVPVERSRPG